MEETHEADLRDGGRASKISPNTSLSQRLHMFTNPEALQTLSFRVLWRCQYLDMIN